MSGTVALAGVLDTADRLVADVTDLLVNGVVPLLGVAFVCWVWSYRKSLVAALAAAIAAGVIWWFVANMDFVRDETDEELNPAVETRSEPAHWQWEVGS